MGLRPHVPLVVYTQRTRGLPNHLQRLNTIAFSGVDTLEGLGPDPFLGADQAEALDTPNVATGTIGMADEVEAQMRPRLRLPRRTAALGVLTRSRIALIQGLFLRLPRPLFAVAARFRTSSAALATLGHDFSPRLKDVMRGHGP